jgi:heat shock protein HspQ
MTPFEPFERSGALPPGMGQKIDIPLARFAIGEVVRHKIFDFRGVVFDVDPVFANSDEWYESIPEAMRPSKDQPFYHLLAENAETTYVAYVSQQNLIADESEEPVDHPAIGTMFEGLEGGRYRLRPEHRH